MLLMLILGGSFRLQAHAANAQKVVDEVGLLSAEEEELLQKQLSDTAEKYQCDAVIAILDGIEGSSMQSYTDQYFYEEGYGYGDERDGIILLVNMSGRKYWFATRGDANRIFTDYGTEIIEERVVPYLSDGEYYEACSKYADLVESFMKEATENEPYDVNHTYSDPMAMWLRLVISLGVGLVVMVITLVILYSQLKSVGAEKRAQEYIRSGSFRVTRERDIFLYSNVTRRKIEKASNGGGGHGGTMTHSSPGGGSSGGRGGSF
jgi:uncharacterized protein